ncbi:MAG: glycosyltransferase [Acidobacteria bacterium]|nr:MAG: glycosyltransferase [Acidobacteriota bacterium]
MERSRPRLAIVVPCYNEEAALPVTATRLTALLAELVHTGAIASDSALYFVDDGSSDRTWDVIEGLAATDPHCHGIKLSRNHGHQHALLSGVLTARGDAVISIDADLQDDVAAIKEMIDAYAAGAEIVYGVRRERHADSWFKRVTAEGYYRFAHLMGVRLVFNHADYRLLSRRAIDALGAYRESNLFLRGLIPQLGFNTATVLYDRHERIAGKSKYPVAKMVGLALDGITSFSAAPLRLITVLGVLVAFVSFGTAVWALWVGWFNPDAVPGWASTLIPLLFLGGIQLLCTGIIGQYLAKVYLETKARPRFIIEKQL